MNEQELIRLIAKGKNISPGEAKRLLYEFLENEYSVKAKGFVINKRAKLVQRDSKTGQFISSVSNIIEKNLVQEPKKRGAAIKGKAPKGKALKINFNKKGKDNTGEDTYTGAERK